MSSRRAKHKSKCWRRRNDQTPGKAIPFEEQPTSRDDSHCFAFPTVNQGAGGHVLFRSQAPTATIENVSLALFAHSSSSDGQCGGCWGLSGVVGGCYKLYSRISLDKLMPSLRDSGQ